MNRKYDNDKGMTSMENPTQVKRKHFRFPAYDDEVGVKLTPINKRKLFQNDPVINRSVEAEVQTLEKVTEPMDPVPGQVQINREKQPTELNKLHINHSQQQVEELAKHKSNLPNYTASWTTSIKKKNNLFGDMHKKKPSDYRNKEAIKTNKHFTSTNYNYDARSYFVPKYIPASVITDEKGPDVSEQDLVEAMKKDQNSYLLFDEEPVPFQEKGAQDPTVKKFNVPKESLDIPVTRRQYQQIKPDMKRFGQGDISHSLPRSRKELKSAKENAKNQTAYDKKVAEADQEKKSGISLSGIISDSSTDLENSKYFN